MLNQSHPDFSDVTVIMPAFNEAEGIERCLRRLKDHCPRLNVIVVDDGSSDGTGEIAVRVADVEVISHSFNRGYGASLKTGMKLVKTPLLVWYDSDGQHRPEDLVRIVEKMQKEKLDACFGMREKGSAFVAKRVPGKMVLRFMSQVIARRRIPDLNCGLRAFRTGLMRSYLHLLPNGFSASSTTTLLFLKRGYRVDFCPIQTEPRVGKSTVRMLRDGFRTMALILRMIVLFDAFNFFVLLSALQIIPGIIYSVHVGVNQRLGIPVLGALVIISGILTFGLGIISSQINEMRQERFELNAIDRDEPARA